MALPVPEWFDPIWKVGALVFAGATTWRLYISRRAVNETEVGATITLCRQHSGQIATLESTGIRVDSRLVNIEANVNGVSSRLSSIEAIANQTLGEIRAMSSGGRGR